MSPLSCILPCSCYKELFPILRVPSPDRCESDTRFVCSTSFCFMPLILLRIFCGFLHCPSETSPQLSPVFQSHVDSSSQLARGVDYQSTVAAVGCEASIGSGQQHTLPVRRLRDIVTYIARQRPTAVGSKVGIYPGPRPNPYSHVQPRGMNMKPCSSSVKYLRYRPTMLLS